MTLVNLSSTAFAVIGIRGIAILMTLVILSSTSFVVIGIRGIVIALTLIILTSTFSVVLGVCGYAKCQLGHPCGSASDCWMLFPLNIIYTIT